MITTPYATTIGSKHRIETIKSGLLMALAEGRLVQPVNGVDSLYALVGKEQILSEIDAFTHPISVMRQNKEIIVIDLRAHSLQQSENGIVYPSVGQTALLIKQALLQIIWGESPESFIRCIEIPMAVFANWIAGAIGRAATLDPQTTIEIKILAGWWFSCQFFNASEYSDNDDFIAQKGTKIARVLRVPFENVANTIRRVGFIADLIGFCQAVSQNGNPRLTRFNATLLTQMVGSSWFGTIGAREMTSVALEFPPTFYGMVHTAATESTFKRAIIAELVLQQKYRDNLHQFDMAIKALLQEAKE